MKRLLVGIAILAYCLPVFAEEFVIQLYTNESFKVSIPDEWALKSRDYIPNTGPEYTIEAKDQTFVLKMLFLLVNEDEFSKDKLRDRLVKEGKEFLKGAVEKKVDVKEMALDKRYGYYATFTDKETAANPAPAPTDYLHLTLGYICLSDQTVLRFRIFSHKAGDDLSPIMGYLKGYVVQPE